MSAEKQEMERDLKGYPDLKAEELYNDNLDYQHEIMLEQANTIVEHNSILKKMKGKIIESKLLHDEILDELLNEYPQAIKNEFLLGEEL